MRSNPLTFGFLWEDRAPDGSVRLLRGKVGSTKIIVKPIEGAPANSPRWALQFAESDTTITPEQMSWQNKRRAE